MPLYEYQCQQCGNTFEMLRRIKDADGDAECPHCHALKVERLFSTFAADGCAPLGARGIT